VTTASWASREGGAAAGLPLWVMSHLSIVTGSALQCQEHGLIRVFAASPPVTVPVRAGHVREVS
jgi:hypothetical protein